MGNIASFEYDGICLDLWSALQRDKFLRDFGKHPTVQNLSERYIIPAKNGLFAIIYLRGYKDTKCCATFAERAVCISGAAASVSVLCILIYDWNPLLLP